MYKAHIGEKEVKKCYIGEKQMSASRLGELIVCKSGPPQRTFQATIKAGNAADATPTNPKTTKWNVDDNGNGTYEVWTTDQIDSFGYDGKATLKEIVVHKGNTIVSLFAAFYANPELTKVDISKCVNNIDLDRGFFNSAKLTEVILGSAPELKKMDHCFFKCKLLENITINGLANVTSALGTFEECDSIKTIDISTMVNIENASKMFFSAIGLEEVIRGTTFNKATEIKDCFANSGLMKFDSTGIDNATDASAMFSRCHRLTNVTGNGFKGATNLAFLFLGCENLICIKELDTTSATGTKNMFKSCTHLVQPDAAAIVDLTDSNGAVWKNSKDCPPPKLLPPRIRYTSTEDLTQLTAYAIGGTPRIEDNGDGTYDLTSDDLCTFIALNGDYTNFYYKPITKIEVIEGNSLTKVRDISGDETGLFAHLQSLKEIIVRDKMQNLVDADCMFQETMNLEKIDITGMDTSKVTTMANMFQGCPKLTGLDLSHLDFSKVTNFNFFLQNCQALAYIKLPELNGSIITNVSGMFSNLPRLKCISKLDTSKLGSSVHKNMFAVNNNNIINPTPAERIKIQSAAGFNYINKNNCP